ncbi:MAG: hypothetical protein IPI34_01980 [bacterium]|nr:hypothetical protein [bacterium]
MLDGAGGVQLEVPPTMLLPRLPVMASSGSPYWWTRSFAGGATGEATETAATGAGP